MKRQHREKFKPKLGVYSKRKMKDSRGFIALNANLEFVDSRFYIELDWEFVLF